MARPQIRIAGRSYDLLNYLRGGAAAVKGEAERAVRQMDDCIRYLEADDGFGLGNTPEHAFAAARRCAEEAKRLVEDVRKVRSHLYRNAAKGNPRSRRR